MTWVYFYEKNKANINIHGFSPQDEEKIILHMGFAYNSSSIYRGMLDDWMKGIPAKHGAISIGRDANTAWAQPGDGEVWLDVAFCEGMKYITDSGEAVRHTLGTVLIHELVHALTGRRDDGAWIENDPERGKYFNGDRTDYKGANVIETNKFSKQLGYKELNSYIGQDRPDTNVISPMPNRRITTRMPITGPGPWGGWFSCVILWRWILTATVLKRWGRTRA